MCCVHNSLIARALNEVFEKRDTITLWKVIARNGQSIFTPYVYKPGTHVANVTKASYNRKRPRGIHVFLNPQILSTWDFKRGDRVVEVTASKNHLIIAGLSWNADSPDKLEDIFKEWKDWQAVFSQITITPEQWEKAHDSKWQQRFARN